MSFQAVVGEQVTVGTNDKGEYIHTVNLILFDLSKEELYMVLDSVNKDTGKTVVDLKKK